MEETICNWSWVKAVLFDFLRDEHFKKSVKVLCTISECIDATERGAPQRQHFGPLAIRYHCGAVVASAPPAVHNSENFQAIFASALDPTPVPHAHFVYDESLCRVVTEIRVFRTFYGLFDAEPYGVLVRLLGWS